jgi:hypothetical protein
MEISNHNLNEILEVVLIKYSEDFSRKSRIESKMVGIVTFLSLLFAVSISIFLVLYSDLQIKNGYLIKILLLALFGQFFFMVASITMSIIGYKTRFTNSIDIDVLFKEWKTEKKEFLGSVSKTLNEASNQNNNVNTTLSFYFDLSRIFLIITFVFFILFMSTTFIIFIGGIYVK